MEFLALVLGWILLSVGLTAMFAAYRVAQRPDARTVEIAVLSMSAVFILAAAGATLLRVAA